MEDKSIDIPPGWSPPMSADDQYICERSDCRRHAFGETPEEAIAAAWVEHRRTDLQGVACTMWRESGLPRGRNPGYVILWCERTPDEDGEPKWSAEILEAIGVSPVALDDLRSGDPDGCFGINSAHLPNCDQCEVLCAVGHDGATESDVGYFYLTVVMLGGSPAIEPVENG